MLHGSSTNCNDEGTGGDLKKLRSMDVYRIVQGKEADDIIQDCFPKNTRNYNDSNNSVFIISFRLRIS